jgi:hypothetical protein
MQDQFDPIASFVNEVKGMTSFLAMLSLPIPSMLLVLLVLGGILVAKLIFS